MTCPTCGRNKVWHGSETSPPPGSYLSEMGCHDGVRMDDDVYHEGWQPDVIYPPCPHSPYGCQTCKGTGRAGAEVTDSDDCPDCQGTGWKNGDAKWPAPMEDEMQITVNGSRMDIPRGDVTYEDVARWAGHPDSKFLSVTYHWQGSGDLQRQGILAAGEKVTGDDGMIFNAHHTGNA